MASPRDEEVTCRRCHESGHFFMASMPKRPRSKLPLRANNVVRARGPVHKLPSLFSRSQLYSDAGRGRSRVLSRTFGRAKSHSLCPSLLSKNYTRAKLGQKAYSANFTSHPSSVGVHASATGLSLSPGLNPPLMHARTLAWPSVQVHFHPASLQVRNKVQSW